MYHVRSCYIKEKMLVRTRVGKVFGQKLASRIIFPNKHKKRPPENQTALVCPEQDSNLHDVAITSP